MSGYLSGCLAKQTCSTCPALMRGVLQAAAVKLSLRSIQFSSLAFLHVAPLQAKRQARCAWVPTQDAAAQVQVPSHDAAAVPRDPAAQPAGCAVAAVLWAAVQR